MNKLWIYDKCRRKAKPQALISMYITFSVVLSIVLFVALFLAAKSIYGYVPTALTRLSLLVIIGLPAVIMMWNYTINSSPRLVIRAYPIYLDENGDLWLFDYNSQAFEDYYDAHALPSASKSRTESRLGGSHKERALEYCIANNAVEEIIQNPPYDVYAHHIIQVGKILEKGGYLRVQFLCHSKISNKKYPATLAFPLDMDGLDEMRAVFERMTGDEVLVQPKEYNEPGVMRVDSLCENKDGCAIIYGIMESGTIARGDRVNYTDPDGKILFGCKIAHLYRDGHEIVWGTPVEDGHDLGYEVHIKGKSISDFAAGHYLRSK